MTILKNLAGIFSGQGFADKQGRHPTLEDCGFIPGPIDCELNPQTGAIQQIAKNISSSKSPLFDASGLIATAGFIDSHTHLLFAGDRSSEYFMRWQGKSYVEISDAGGGIHNTVKQSQACDAQDLLYKCTQDLHKILSQGTTTIEIKSGYANSAKEELSALSLIQQLKQSFSRDSLFSTFLALHALPQAKKESDYVNEMIAILEEAQQKHDIDFVDCFPEVGFFSLEESLRFTDAAQKLGLKLKIHADEITDLGSSLAYIKRGASSIDHLQKISEEAVSALSEHSTVATLLPATSFYLGLEYANARKLIDRGARVALATDYNPGTAPHNNMAFTQLLAASQMKLNPAEILCASTYNAAAALNAENDRGTLQTGLRADLSLWKCYSVKPEQILCELFVNGPSPVAVFQRAHKIC